MALPGVAPNACKRTLQGRAVNRAPSSNSQNCGRAPVTPSRRWRRHACAAGRAAAVTCQPSRGVQLKQGPVQMASKCCRRSCCAWCHALRRADLSGNGRSDNPTVSALRPLKRRLPSCWTWADSRIGLSSRAPQDSSRNGRCLQCGWPEPAPRATAPPSRVRPRGIRSSAVRPQSKGRARLEARRGWAPRWPVPVVREMGRRPSATGFDRASAAHALGAPFKASTAFQPRPATRCGPCAASRQGAADLPMR